MRDMNTAELIRAVPTKLWIGGTPVDAENGATFPVHDPATGEVLTHVADASPADAVKALDAAVGGPPGRGAPPPPPPGGGGGGGVVNISRPAEAGGPPAHRGGGA
ncbi:hypothetical protein M2280_002264, partial [Prescottella agglutinans]|nr:hypothetical protein [Prescottella agglutinans]